MSKTITKSKYGICDFCDNTSYTLNFDEENWGDCNVNFEICPICFTKLMSVLEDNREYRINEVYKIMSK